MVTPPPGGTTTIDYNRAFTDITDGNGQPVKFEEKKDSPGDFEGKGTDGNLYSFSTKNVVVSIAASAAIDTKELRRRNPGIPLPKDEAKKLDEEIKKENEERRKFAEQGTSPEAEAIRRRADTTQQQQQQERQQQQSERQEKNEKHSETRTERTGEKGKLKS